ncbi:sensor histidine kinase [Actinoplanes xinjiangensis]|uniref:sensor histidine kinase n=1 Tax=Actinoplanes xinjiangensis TaxID=512350 RepID=UPI0034301B2F
MVTVDETLLHDPVRLEAVRRARSTLPALPMPLDAIARFAARLLDAPMGVVTLVGCDEEYFAGVHELPASLAGHGRAPIAYSVCQYMVSVDHPVWSGDMSTDDDPLLRHHPLTVEYGVRAFLGVPLRDGDDRLVGSLTVLDTVARQWSDEQMTLLVWLAELLHPTSVRAGAAARVPAAADTSLRAPATAQIIDADEADVRDGFLTALLDSLSVGVIACDAAGQVVLVNRALREAQHLPATGRVSAEHAAAAAAMLLDVDGTPLPVPQTPLMRAWRGEHVHDTDVLVKAGEDRIRTFNCNGRPIIGADGRLRGAVVAAHEVTAVRRTQKFRICHAAVTRALAAASSAAEAAPAVLQAIATALGWPHAQLWLVDDVTDSLTPIGQWSAPGTSLGDLTRHTVSKGEGVTGRAWATGESMWVCDTGTAEAVTLHTQHAQAVAEAWRRHGIRTVLSVPIRHDSVLGVLTCYADAPEYQQDQLTVLLDGIAAQIGVFLALRRAGDLSRQLARSKDDFIALVGHEMRTPLTSIAAYATILAEEGDGIDDDHRQMMQAIERNTIMLRDIVDTLLDLAGLDSGHVGLDIAPVDFARITAETAATVNDSTRVHADLPDHLIMDGDAHRLRQIVTHLLSNAIAYSPPGSDVHLHLTVEGGIVQLRVTDTGIGIPADERRHLFDRFYRASNVRHHGTRGAGLGLSLVHTIVELHAGAITVTAQQPSGTTVLVRLPQHTGLHQR